METGWGSALFGYMSDGGANSAGLNLDLETVQTLGGGSGSVGRNLKVPLDRHLMVLSGRNSMEGPVSQDWLHNSLVKHKLYCLGVKGTTISNTP